MATAISVDNFRAALGEAYDAITAQNYGSAEDWALKALAQHSGLAAHYAVADRNLARANWAALDALLKLIRERRATANAAAGGRLIRTQVGISRSGERYPRAWSPC